MRTMLALFLCVFVWFSTSLHAADALEGEESVVIPPNVTFDIPRTGETGWNVDIDLDARYYYAGVMGEAIYNFATKMTMNGLTASQVLTYTDPQTDRSISAPMVFRPGDAILDELGAREEFEEIKLLKAYFSVSLGGFALAHFFMDQEVFAPSGEWGTNLGTSLPDWNAFTYGNEGAIRHQFGGLSSWGSVEGNDYSPDEIETIKKAYADALRSGSKSCLITLLTEPKPQFSGLIEFENAVLSGLRAKVQKEKPVVSAEALNRAVAGGAARGPAAPASPRESARAFNVNEILAKRLAAVRDVSRQKIDSAISSGNVSTLGDLPRLRGQWQAINRYIDREKVFLLDPTLDVNREADETVNLKSSGTVNRLENAIALAAAREAAATLGTINFTCPNHMATVSDAGNGKIRFNDTIIDIREMTDARSTSGGGDGTLEIFTGGGRAWSLGDCGNIDDVAERKLELVSGTLRQGIEQQRSLRRQIDEAVKGVVAVSESELAREIADIRSQADNAVQKADISTMRELMLKGFPSFGNRDSAPRSRGGTSAPSIADLREKMRQQPSTVPTLIVGNGGSDVSSPRVGTTSRMETVAPPRGGASDPYPEPTRRVYHDDNNEPYYLDDNGERVYHMRGRTQTITRATVMPIN